MNKEAYLRLADALESGKYKQTFDRLANENGCFCAVGVACEIFKEELGLIKREVDGEILYGDESNPYGSEFGAPYTLKRHFDNEPSPNTLLNEIMGWNDFENLGFKTIAQGIRTVVEEA